MHVHFAFDYVWTPCLLNDMKSCYVLKIVLFIIIFAVQVSNLVKKSSEALAKIGLYDPEDLPPEFKPAINFVHKVSKLFGDIKADVMGFINVRLRASVETYSKLDVKLLHSRNS